MKTHTLIISTSYDNVREKVLRMLEAHPMIQELHARPFKEKTILKVKSEDNLRIRQIKHLIYSTGYYAKPVQGIFAKVKNSLMMAVV